MNGREHGEHMGIVGWFPRPYPLLRTRSLLQHVQQVMSEKQSTFLKSNETETLVTYYSLFYDVSALSAAGVLAVQSPKDSAHDANAKNPDSIPPRPHSLTPQP